MSATATFQTPPRILIPKLVKSRDAWKAKATARKAERKALEIRVRDLEASRNSYRQHAEQLRQRVRELEQQLAAASGPAPAPPPASQKNSTPWTGPGAGIMTAPSSPWG